MTFKRKLPIARWIAGGLITCLGGWAIWFSLSEGHIYSAGFAFAAVVGAYAGLLDPQAVKR